MTLVITILTVKHVLDDRFKREEAVSIGRVWSRGFNSLPSHMFLP